jgi:hypothetical protein
MKTKLLFTLLLAFLIILLVASALAHEEEIHEDGTNEEDAISNAKSNSLIYVSIASALSVLAIACSFFCKRKTEKLKIILFLAIVLPTVIVTSYLIFTTIQLNIISETKGPVHYHADFEIWKCGEPIDLIKPNGLTNRIGTPIFHEHNDNRIHVEGVVIKKSNIDLHNFLKVVGGSLTNEKLTIPTDSGIIELSNDETCNASPAKLQAFLYKIDNPDATKKSGFTYTQTKLIDFENYILSPYQNIPPGDCIILELSPEKTSTNKICESFRVALQEGDLTES